MAAQFEEDGIQLLYPENWELQRDETDSGWTISLQSPDTAFLVMSFDAEMPDPELMAQAALEALRGDYEDLESEPVVAALAGQPAVGHDVRFFSMDLTNSCWIRSFYMPSTEQTHCYFEGVSKSAIEEANQRARIPFDEVIEVIEMTPESV